MNIASEPIVKDNSITMVTSLKHCICGNSLQRPLVSCESCVGYDSVHLEGEILKKQKKTGKFKNYWFVLLGKELYTYRKKGDVKHKEMRSLSDIYISENLKVEKVSDDVYYPFVLIFPNKKRIYYCRDLKEKILWINSIKKSVGFCNLDDYYEIGEIIGKGKYGVVRKA